MPKPKFEKGDIVIYSRAFLRSIGARDAQTANQTGVVEGETLYKGMTHPVVKVLWEGSTEAQGCLACNLIKKNTKHLEPV
jgi:hypothetical protein